MFCWHCGRPLELTNGTKINFREECPHCQAALHCCKNCVYYQPGKPNDCAVPGTDYVADRTKMNFCEEFKILGKPPKQGPDPKDVSRKLFHDDDAPKKKTFEDLF